MPNTKNDVVKHYFTLVELTVVLALVSVITAVVGLRIYNGTTTNQAKESVQRIQEQLSLCQELSSQLRLPIQVTAEQKTTELLLYASCNEELPSSLNKAIVVERSYSKLYMYDSSGRAMSNYSWHFPFQENASAIKFTGTNRSHPIWLYNDKGHFHITNVPPIQGDEHISQQISIPHEAIE
ncbi:type II secretion system protein [Simkania negevensis]|uniref:Type II secretion system protein n=1 Tax=Simkania negevensis TaxID=83561 RepID=A0ABS3ARV8_9BACT|nr:type II secretion system protein [Simkania negevensis]